MLMVAISKVESSMEVNVAIDDDATINSTLGGHACTPHNRSFNSLKMSLQFLKNEPIANLGGMALQFSLPEMPILLTLSHHDAVWLGEVKEQRYSLPSKDKFVLASDHGDSIFPKASASPVGDLRHPRYGLILARFDNRSTSISPRRQ